MTRCISRYDKIVIKKPCSFGNVGDTFIVKGIMQGFISFENIVGEPKTKIVTSKTFDKYFDKCGNQSVDKVTKDDIDSILDKSDIVVTKMFDRCTVVSCQLPSGFVIVEYSASVDPSDYDESIGREICMGKIIDKIRELESYGMQREKK